MTLDQFVTVHLPTHGTEQQLSSPGLGLLLADRQRALSFIAQCAKRVSSDDTTIDSRLLGAIFDVVGRLTKQLDDMEVHERSVVAAFISVSLGHCSFMQILSFQVALEHLNGTTAGATATLYSNLANVTNDALILKEVFECPSTVATIKYIAAFTDVTMIARFVEHVAKVLMNDAKLVEGERTLFFQTIGLYEAKS